MAGFKIDFDIDKIEKELSTQFYKLVAKKNYEVNVDYEREVNGMVIIDKMYEDALKTILEHYDANEEYSIQGRYDWFPKYMKYNMDDVFEKLKMSGMLASYNFFCGNTWCANLTPNGITYFKDKEEYLKQKAEEEKKSNGQNIININADRSNVVVGDVTNSTLSIDNSIHEIEKMIDEKGGEDKEQLIALLDEAKELLENINESRMIPKNKGFVKRLSDHMSKHGWFYGAVVQLLGTGALTLLGK